MKEIKMYSGHYRTNRIILFITVLIVFVKTMSGQEKMSIGAIDTLSYKYYMNAEWDSLLTLRTIADEQKIHFYYFDYRLGIACYFKGNYMMASYYLEKANKLYFDAPADLYFAGYLYSSYVYTNQLNKAASLQKFVDPSLLLISKPNKKIYSLYLDYGYGITGNYPKRLSAFNGQEFIQYTKETSYSFYNFGLSGQLFPNLRYYTEFSIYKTDRQTTMLDGVIDSTNTDKIIQNQFYISLNYQLSKTWSLNPALHFSSLKTNPLQFKYPDKYPESLETDTLKYFQYALSIDLNKTYKKVSMGAQIATSRLSDSNQYQAGLYLNYLPKGNLNLYSKTSLFTHFQSRQMQFIFGEKIGFKLFPKLWFEASATIGKMNNFMDENANIIYNTADGINGAFGLGLFYFTNKHILFKINYKMYNMVTTRSIYTVDNPDGIFTEVNYKKHLISGGLVWKF